MITTVFTIITMLIVATLVICGLNLWISHSIYEVQYSPQILLLIVLLPFIRLLLPVEFAFTKVIPSFTVYPAIYDFFNQHFIQIGTIDLSFISILFIAWLMGTLVVFVNKLRKHYAVTKCFKHLPDSNDTEIDSIIQSFFLRNCLAEHKIRIVHTLSVQEPLIYGIRKTVIVLPSYTFSHDDLHNVLFHELSHYKHRDVVLKWLLEIICALYWWLPPIYVLKRHVYDIMEIRADRNALADGSNEDRVNYLNTIYSVCKRIQSKNLRTTHALAQFSYGSKKTIKRRFDAIANLDNGHHGKTRKTVVIFAILSFLMLLSFVFVLQPQGYRDGKEIEGTYPMEDLYLMKGHNGTYDIYCNGEYFSTITEISEEMKGIPIINE